MIPYIFCNDSFPVFTRKMTHSPRRLSEQDLATLYVHTEAPLKLDALLQSGDITKRDGLQIDVHDVIGAQTPDMALMSLSLCALIVLRDYPEQLKDGACGPILRELLWDAEDNLLTVGRLWLDTHFNGITPDPKADKETLLSIPDRLRILTSIFMELRDALDADDRTQIMMHHALNVLYYQSESHADLADVFIDNLKAKPKKQTDTKPKLDQVPLPFDLTRPKDGAEIVNFSLFNKPK